MCKHQYYFLDTYTPDTIQSSLSILTSREIIKQQSCIE